MSCRAGTRALVGLGLGGPRALGCPSTVTVGKSIRVGLEPQKFVSQKEGTSCPTVNVLSRVLGATWSPLPQHGASRSSSDPTPEPWAGRAGICFPGRRRDAGRLGLVGKCHRGEQATGTRRKEPHEPTAGVLILSC